MNPILHYSLLAWLLTGIVVLSTSLSCLGGGRGAVRWVYFMAFWTVWAAVNILWMIVNILITVSQ